VYGLTHTFFSGKGNIFQMGPIWRGKNILFAFLKKVEKHTILHAKERRRGARANV